MKKDIGGGSENETVARHADPARERECEERPDQNAPHNVSRIVKKQSGVH